MAAARHIKIIGDTVAVYWEEYVQDTLPLRFNWLNPDNSPVDLTGFAVVLDIYRRNETAPVLALTQNSGVTLGGADHNIAATLTDSQTLALGAGEFPYYLKLTAPDGHVNTLVAGHITLKPRICP